MVDKPDEDKAVFVRVLRDVGDIFVEGTDRRFEMKRGDVWVVRWWSFGHPRRSTVVEVKLLRPDEA
jgi:hypothetical protein